MSAQPVDQRLEALDRANRIRVWRARFKRDLKTHPHLAVFQLSTPTPWIESMRVSELVRALPYYGERKTMRLLWRCGIPAEKTIGTLTQRQRSDITRYIKRDLTREPPRERTRGKVCVRGHDLTDPNVVRIRTDGRKRCLRCETERNREQRQRDAITKALA